MSRSPGHQSNPEHEVRETRLTDVVKVRLEGLTLAESEDVIRVDETAARRATTSRARTSAWRRSNPRNG